MLQHDFIQRALIAGLAMSFITPILGLFLILRGQSLLSDTLSHISLAGVALGVMYHYNPTWTTLIVVVVASIIIEVLRTIYKDFTDVSVAIMMSAGMAVAFVLIGLSNNQANFRIEQYLFGSIILVSPANMKLLIGLAVAVVSLYIIFKRPLYVLSFDEDTAYTVGLPTRFMSIVFSVFTGLTISIMLPIVGALLVSALIVIPSATAIKVARSFTQTVVIGIIINIIGIFSGITTSYYFDTPPGASITLYFIAIFLAVVLFQKLWNMYKKRRSS